MEEQCIFDMIKDETDYQRIASVFFPEQSGNQDPFWIDAARAVFAAFLSEEILKYYSDAKLASNVSAVLHNRLYN